MFEAYPDTLAAYNTAFGAIAGVYNGGDFFVQILTNHYHLSSACFSYICIFSSSLAPSVPFLPFAVFFLLSYIARAPTFPVETRFHASQAFMLSILQFPASVLFPIMEKAGVPGEYLSPYLPLCNLISEPHKNRLLHFYGRNGGFI